MIRERPVVAPVGMLRSYRDSRELFWNLTLRELRSKYKRSFFGWAWSLANPLATTLIFTVVFSYIIRIKPAPGQPSGLDVFALYLLCGLLPFNYFQSGVNGAMGALLGNGNLIKKSYFPRELLPVSTIGATLVSHLVEMSLLVVLVVGYGNYRALEWLPVTVVLIALVTVLSVGLGLLFSVLNVFFRDVQHFTGILFTVWFYLTPIVYPIEQAHRFAFLLKLNPLTDAVLCFRATLYNGTHPVWSQMAYLAVAAVVALVVGQVVFDRFEDRLAEEL